MTLFFEFGAFLWLKYSGPDMERPYSVPGQLWGALFITIPKFVLLCVTVGVASLQVWILCGSFILGSVLLYFAWKQGLLTNLNGDWRPKDAEFFEDE